MSTKGSIYYKYPLHIYHEMNDGFVYLEVRTNFIDIKIEVCRVEFFYKVKKYLKLVFD